MLAEFTTEDLLNELRRRTGEEKKYRQRNQMSLREWNKLWKRTSKPREFNEIEQMNFRRYSDDSTEYLYPEFEGCLYNIPFAPSELDTGVTPVYRVYLRGENFVEVYKYDWQEDAWKYVEINYVTYIYRLIWHLSYEIYKLKKLCKEKI
jgi:hypothetical protein